MREFTTAVEEIVDDQEAPIEFKLDDVTLRAYRPTQGQVAMAMAATGRHTNDQTRMAGIIDFFVEIMDEQSHQHVVQRLLSRTDPLGLEQVQDIIMWLMEEWSGRPTQPLSVSTQSRQSGGPKSKQRTTKKTSSAARSGSS